MRSSITRIVILSTLAIQIGCTTTPRHSNTLIFGTTTKFAIDVSFEPAAGGTPDITVGYKRHEGVWLPLLGNRDVNGTMVPADCNGTAGDCLYQGKDSNTTQVDTYSVLASFGAKFGAGAKTNPGEGNLQPSAYASGGLAQFFATGLAARKLAEKGNSRLVAIQPADTEALNDARERANTLEMKLFEKIGDERVRNLKLEGEALAKDLNKKMDTILTFVAPQETFNKQKWNELVEKSSLDNDAKIKLKEIDDYSVLYGTLENQLTSKDATIIESLYKAINTQQ